MDIFEQASARAHEIAPPPPDKPIAASLTAFGFGLLVVAIFFVLQWFGLPAWMAWIGAAMAYGAIAYADCQLAWNRNRREYQEALADLKSGSAARSVH